MLRRGTDRITKLYLDSRTALPDGSIQLPCDIQLDPSTRVLLAEFSTVASWDTIDDSNNSFYMVERVNDTDLPRIVAIPNGPFDLDTLAAALQTRLNRGKRPGLGNYSVIRRGRLCSTRPARWPERTRSI